MEAVGRVFAAIALPEEIRLALEDRLAGIDVPGKPAPLQNWHITLRFLGRIEEVTYERFLAAIEHLPDPFTISLDGFGAFPNPRRATVLWLGIDQGAEEATKLASIAEEAAQAAGLDAEERPFHPHLTLARIRPPENVTGLIETEFEPLRWRCESMVVYESILGGRHPRYEALETFALTR